MFYYLQVHWYARERRKAKEKDRKMSNSEEVMFEDQEESIL
jgi:hypothetical protein